MDIKWVSDVVVGLCRSAGSQPTLHHHHHHNATTSAHHHIHTHRITPVQLPLHVSLFSND